MTNSRSCEHENSNVEIASKRLNGVADPEGATVVSIPISEKSFIAGKVDATSDMRKSVPVKTPTCGTPESPLWQSWDRETRV